MKKEGKEGEGEGICCTLFEKKKKRRQKGPWPSFVGDEKKKTVANPAIEKGEEKKKKRSESNESPPHL